MNQDFLYARLPAIGRQPKSLDELAAMTQSQRDAYWANETAAWKAWTLTELPKRAAGAAWIQAARVRYMSYADLLTVGSIQQRLASSSLDFFGGLAVVDPLTGMYDCSRGSPWAMQELRVADVSAYLGSVS